MSARIRPSLVLTGRSCAKDSIPASCEELRLLRTYTLEAGSSPTCTTASPGRRPWRAANCAAREATAARTLAATSLPSSSTAPPAVRTGPADQCAGLRSEEHTSELQSQSNLVCRLLLEKEKDGRR